MVSKDEKKRGKKKQMVEGQSEDEQRPGAADSIETQIDAMTSLESLSGIVEALLFVSDDPLPAERIAEVAGEQTAAVKRVLSRLAKEYETSDRGFQLKEVAGGYRLYSHPAYAPYIEKMIQMWDTRRLSQASLEALAIVAYKQPVTRLVVNAIRGVNSEGVISSLVEKHLVRPVGRERSPGNPILYGTTKTFLERFGLRSLRDLPPLEEFAPDEKTCRQIEQGLGARAEETSETAVESAEEEVEAAERPVPAPEGFDARRFLERGTAHDGT